MNIAECETHPESALEDGGYMKGVAIALVKGNVDSEGRVTVTYPWHHDPSKSYLARLAMPMAGDGRGLICIPEVDDEVLVAFEREDIRIPYVLGSLWNGVDKPPVVNKDEKDGNDKRIWKSRKKHFLLFDDGAKGVVTLAHEQGRKVVLDDNGFTVTDGKGNEVKVDSTTGKMTVKAVTELEINAPTISIHAKVLNLKADGTLKINGAMVLIN